MAKTIEKLSDRKVRAKTKPGLYADGANLWLQVAKGGSKSWIFRYMRNGHARKMGLGSFTTVSLADARAKALACRKVLDADGDPIGDRKAQRTAKRLAAARSKTFRECAKEFLADNEASWRNEKHRAQWSSSLAAHAYPAFGAFPVAEVDLPLVLTAVKSIWKTTPETASRVRQRIERVLDWATVHGYRQGENPARWNGHLEHLLPARNKARTVEHHPALPYAEMSTFMAELRGRDGLAALALELAILTATRTGEVIGATWDEINLKTGTWTIPATRMKAAKEHRVPLSRQAVDLLKRLEKNGDLVFGQDGKPLPKMGMLKVLERMGRGDITVHGFRSTFRDWASEMTAYPREVCEMALAHVVDDKTEAAYRRGDLWDKRARLMNDWAGYCSAPRAAKADGNVAPIRGAQHG